MRLLLIVFGWGSVVLAVIGIFLPLLPTVPLLLLAAACFARSSERFYHWLVTHPRLGPLISDYLNGQGIPRRAKFYAIGLLWLSISLSVLLWVPLFWVDLLLILIGAGVTIYLLRLPLAVADELDRNC
jgi:uncharacterized membrane protein YbaN (DUF454 family)